MESKFSVEDLDRFFAEKGMPSNLGCADNDIEKWESYCKVEYAEKGICVVRDWAIVECTCGEFYVHKLRQMGLLPFVMLTNCVVSDSRNRWPSGSFAISYFIVELKEFCLAVTKNTVYILTGNGHEKSISPSMLNSIFEAFPK